MVCYVSLVYGKGKRRLTDLFCCLTGQGVGCFGVLDTIYVSVKGWGEVYSMLVVVRRSGHCWDISLL